MPAGKVDPVDPSRLRFVKFCFILTTSALLVLFIMSVNACHASLIAHAIGNGRLFGSTFALIFLSFIFALIGWDTASFVAFRRGYVDRWYDIEVGWALEGDVQSTPMSRRAKLLGFYPAVGTFALIMLSATWPRLC